MWPHNLHDAWLLSLPALVPYMILMSLKMMERQTPFTSETFLHEYDYIVGKSTCPRIESNQIKSNRIGERELSSHSTASSLGISTAFVVAWWRSARGVIRT